MRWFEVISFTPVYRDLRKYIHLYEDGMKLIWGLLDGWHLLLNVTPPSHSEGNRKEYE